MRNRSDRPRREFAARIDELPFLLAQVERRCGELGLPSTTGLRAVLMVEELFVNAVRHGGARTFVRVELSLLEDELELCFEDGGVAFDPLVRLSTAHERPVGERPVGGLGLVLIQSYARRREYRRIDERNCLRLWLAREA